MAYVAAFCLFSILILIAIVVVFQRQEPQNGFKTFPGPTGKPIIGNLLDIPTVHSWLKFKEWADQYGPVFKLKVMNRQLLVLSSEKVANDLLRERGSLYSSREQLPMAAKLMSRDLRPLFLPYGDQFRRTRKLMHVLTMPAAAASYEPVQIHESERLLYDLIRQPHRYEALFERYAGALIMRLGYGKTVDSGDDSYQAALRVVHTVERVASPGAYLVDTFPFLMHLPSCMAPFKQEAAKLHKFELNLFRSLLEEVRSKMQNNDCPDCFAKTFLQRQSDFGLTNDEGAYVVGTLFEAGSGTTAAAMMSLCLAFCHYPEWQARLQEELDSIVGKTRMPDFTDMSRLPTVRAVAKEVLRWRPVTAGGIPHELSQDDTYNGYIIKKGTNVHANQWAIHRESSLYPDPETFNPARWLDSSYPTYREPLSKYPSLQNFSAFGFGRRICPGMNIAERSLYLLTARLGWACDVLKRPGVKYPTTFAEQYGSGFNVQPLPFLFDLKVRSKEHNTIITQSWEKRSILMDSGAIERYCQN